MTVVRLLTPLLLITGGAALLGVGVSGRPRLITRLRIVDGLQERRREERWRAVSSLLAVLALGSIPFGLWVVRPATWAGVGLVTSTAVVVLPILLTVVIEVVVMIRGAGVAPPLPVVLPWQRRVATALALAIVAPLPTPTSRPTRAAPRSTPGRRREPARTQLLIVRPPEGRETVRLWQIADHYLGDWERVDELIELNTDGRGHDGLAITADTQLSAGTSLVVPAEARGPGIVDLPRGTGTETGPADDGETVRRGAHRRPKVVASAAAAGAVRPTRLADRIRRGGPPGHTRSGTRRYRYRYHSAE